MSQSVEDTSVMHSYIAYVVVEGVKDNIKPIVECNTSDKPKEMAKYVARNKFLEQYPDYIVTRISVNALIIKGK